MKPSSILVNIVVCLAGLVAAAPATLISDPNPTSPIEARYVKVDVCNNYKVKPIVKILKAKKASSFCSSLLCIKAKTTTKYKTVSSTGKVTKTRTITATRTITKTAKVASTVIDTTTDTTTATTVITDGTLTESFTATRTVATIPTIVSTVVTTSSAYYTVTITPPPAPSVTITVYTTPLVNRRSAAVIEERKVKCPQYLTGHASSAITQACSCLRLPTPTKTLTKTITRKTTRTFFVTTTTTATATASATSIAITTATVTDTDTTISTSLVTDSESITETSSVTYIAPTGTITTTVTTYTVSETLPVSTPTETVYRAIRSECQYILSGNKLYSGGTAGRDIMSEYTIFTWENSGSETDWSECCMRCWDRRNCSLYYNQLFPNGRTLCYFYVNSTPVATNITPICPLGILNSGQSQSNGNGLVSAGLGACWKVW